MPALPHVFTALTLSAACQLAIASDSSHAPAPKAATASATPKAEALRDPLDEIRERLAHKLSAGQTRDAANPNLIRVVTKTSASVTAEPAHAPASLHADSNTLVSGQAQPLAKRAAVRRSVTTAADPTPAGMAGHAANWNYGDAGGGPERWGGIKPEFAKCSTGSRQSPIDIRDGIKVDLDPVHFDYQPSGFRVIDNGHTVQVNVTSGNSIEVIGRRYELVQFHFHRPSEERIDGKQFDMVVHLVHKDLDGRLAVVAVLLERGAALGVVQSVWNNLPLEKGDEVAARSLLNPAELLPAGRSYLTYMGSLTTPPCSEGVLWMVMKQPVSISLEQIGIFARLYAMNARPIQAVSGRLIKESH